MGTGEYVKAVHSAFSADLFNQRKLLFKRNEVGYILTVVGRIVTALSVRLSGNKEEIYMSLFNPVYHKGSFKVFTLVSIKSYLFVCNLFSSHYTVFVNGYNIGVAGSIYVRVTRCIVIAGIKVVSVVILQNKTV